MSNQEEIKKLKEEIEFYKQKSEQYSQSWRLALTEGRKAKQDEINVARFNVARILTSLLLKDIKRICFTDSKPDDGLKSDIIIALNKLKSEMNIHFEDGMFYFYSEQGNKSIVDGIDLTQYEIYNKEWMK
jgi:hypothetical protein